MTSAANISPDDVIKFWFDAGPKKWWIKDPDFDQKIIELFGAAHQMASLGELDKWAETPRGAIALTILLDQFSRNMFRNDPKTYAQDKKARDIARLAIERGFDQQFTVDERAFFYLPFMHAEDRELQAYCVALYRVAGNQSGITHALDHADIINRFGRFPHRNMVLGRTSSPAELAFLRSGGFSG